MHFTTNKWKVKMQFCQMRSSSMAPGTQWRARAHICPLLEKSQPSDSLANSWSVNPNNRLTFMQILWFAFHSMANECKFIANFNSIHFSYNVNDSKSLFFFFSVFRFCSSNNGRWVTSDNNYCRNFNFNFNLNWKMSRHSPRLVCALPYDQNAPSMWWIVNTSELS